MTNPTPVTGLQGIWGKGTGSSVVLYVGQHSTRIARFASSAWGTVYQDPSNVNVSSVWVSPNEEVFAVGDHYVDQCTTNCTQMTSWAHKLVVPIYFTAVCGIDLQHVYAVGNSASNVGLLYKYNTSTTDWDEISSNTGSYWNQACWVSSNFDVYIAAQAKMIRYNGSTFIPETIDFPMSWTPTDQLYQYWKAVSGFGTDVYATGSKKRIIWRDSAGHWSWVFDPGSQNDFDALAASASGAFAGGNSNTGSEPTIAMGFHGTWAYDPAAPELSVWSAWSASDTEYYITGYESGAAIYQGTR